MTEVHVLIDVSNVCRDHRGWQATDVQVARAADLPLPPPEREREDAVLDRYIAVCEAARRKWGKDARIRGWADSSLFRRFGEADRERYRRLVADQEIREADEADDPLLSDAKALRAVVISKDNFRGKRGHGDHDWLNGTTDRLWEPTVALVGGRVKVDLNARKLSDISDSSVRRGANDDLIKANGLTDEDLQYDYRCVGPDCPLGRKDRMAVFPLRAAGGAAGDLICPKCSVKVVRTGRRSEPVKRWKNKNEQRRQARTADSGGPDDFLELPPLDGLPSTGELSGLRAGEAAPTRPSAAGVPPRAAAPDASRQVFAPTAPDTLRWDLPGGPEEPAGTSAPPWQAPSPAPAPAPVTVPAPVSGAASRVLRVDVDVRGRRVHTESLGPGRIVLGRLAAARETLPKGETGLNISAGLGEEARDVSRRHLVIRFDEDGTVTLLDTSVNGVTLEGRPMPSDTHVRWTGERISMLDEQIQVRLHLAHG
ncbi:FHA domain-containing protein [Streptomyces sp. NPDC002599]|uniref:FHA domain-containing protein n=1 Tax=Streptomyces sp. NPDC002599 TaxID=3154421 RepID=UPI003326EE67